MMQMHPYILNINEDAQLSGVVKLFIQEGLCLSSFSHLCRSAHPLQIHHSAKLLFKNGNNNI